MGRPINKRYLGVDGGAYTGEQFTAVVKVGSNPVSNEGIIISQRAERVFIVNDQSDGSGNRGSCTLVDKEVPEENEMLIRGYVDADEAWVNIRKLHNRTVIDFENNRYDWELQDDSTGSILVLYKI